MSASARKATKLKNPHDGPLYMVAKEPNEEPIHN